MMCTAAASNGQWADWLTSYGTWQTASYSATPNTLEFPNCQPVTCESLEIS